jgi:hypothetical protein
MLLSMYTQVTEITLVLLSYVDNLCTSSRVTHPMVIHLQYNLSHQFIPIGRSSIKQAMSPP